MYIIEIISPKRLLITDIKTSLDKIHSTLPLLYWILKIAAEKWKILLYPQVSIQKLPPISQFLTGFKCLSPSVKIAKLNDLNLFNGFNPIYGALEHSKAWVKIFLFFFLSQGLIKQNLNFECNFFSLSKKPEKQNKKRVFFQDFGNWFKKYFLNFIKFRKLRKMEMKI